LKTFSILDREAVMLKNLAALILLAGTVVVNPSYESQCHRLAELCRSISVQRDHGISKTLVKKSMKEDPEFGKLIDFIYDKGRSIPPHVVYDLVYSQCIILHSNE
jgi:hypothetical protein